MKNLLNLLLLLTTCTFLAIAQTHTVTLTWVDTQNPAGVTYTVYRTIGLCSGTPTFSKLATAVTVKTYADRTVTPGNYCYEVTATVNGAESVPSNTVAPTVLPFPPQTVTFTVAQFEVLVPSARS